MVPAVNTVQVLWWTSNDGVGRRGYWDQALLEDVFARRVWRPALGPEYLHTTDPDELDGGAVVVVPARMENGEVGPLQQLLDRLPWVLLVLTSDEERAFPWQQLRHPNMRVWVQTPHPHRDADADHVLPVGYPPDTPELADRYVTADRPLDWAFMGQVTHRRREQAAQAMRGLDGGQLLETDGFTAGVPREAYLADLAAAKLAPCPGGPQTPDTFRLWEALEAGCVPLVDTEAGEREMVGYWRRMLGATPWPEVGDWVELGRLVRRELADWPANAVRCSAWWQAYKRDLAYQLDDAVAELRGCRPAPGSLADLVTVLVPTSPVVSHPSLSMLVDTLASIGAAGLAECEVIVMADGVRAEQAHYQQAYTEALRELVECCEHDWPNVLPVVHASHQHQARMARHALGVVRTPLLLFVEHDCPLVGEFDWWRLCNLLLADRADLVRFHHEAAVHPEHLHLMVGEGPAVWDGVPVWPTRQWSQRPHLARADYYRRILADHFDPDERWMIEDRMHTVVQDAAWADHRLLLYHPDGSLVRHRHTDGRQGDPKWVDR